ncbi:MAG: TonB-dependent receptor [Proteobacteria bacterium]|nr:TonB-dependent receptor [Pseudomonadota bacterium]
MTKDVLIAALVSAQTFAVAAESPATPAATPAAATPAEKDVKNPLKITGSFGVLGSKKKVGGVTVIALPSKEVSIESKADGTFEIEAPQGTTILTYKKDGYVSGQVLLEPNQKDIGNILLEPSAELLGVGVIRARRKVEVSQQSLTRDEVFRVPGTGGDAVSALQTLPSVLPVFPGAANVVVRGSAPEDTKSFYDRLEIPFVFHLGGLGTVIPTRALEGIDFYPGGFSAPYNDAIGATIQLRSENKTPQRTSSEVEIALKQSALYFETPTTAFGESPVGVRAGFRRSYLEIFVPIIKKVAGKNLQLFTVPNITDYQLILDGKHSRGTWQAYLIGAADRLSLVVPAGQANNAEGNAKFSLFNYFEVSGFRYSANLGNGWGLTAVPQQRLVIINQEIFENTVDVRGNRFGLDVTIDKKFSEQFSASAGIRPEHDRTVSKVNAIQLPPTGFTPFFDTDTAQKSSSDVKRNTTTLQAHIDTVWKPDEKIVINPGVAFLQGNTSAQRATDPRFSARWQAFEATSLKLAAGLYSQRPQPQFDSPQYGNPDLTLERARHLVLGVEHNLFADVDVDVQVYDKKLWDITGTATENPLLKYENNIEGRAYGAEILLRKTRKGIWNGWLSYGYSKSERKDPALKVWRTFSFDRPHALNVVGSYRLTGRWEFGARFQYLSGGPYNILNGGVYNQNTGRYRPVAPVPTPVLAVNDGRNPPFAQLDVRTDYDFLFTDWTLTTFFELQNATNRENTVGYRNAPDFSSREPIAGTPIIPNLGIKAVF